MPPNFIDTTIKVCALGHENGHLKEGICMVGVILRKTILFLCKTFLLGSNQ